MRFEAALFLVLLLLPGTAFSESPSDPELLAGYERCHSVVHPLPPLHKKYKNLRAVALYVGSLGTLYEHAVKCHDKVEQCFREEHDCDRNNGNVETCTKLMRPEEIKGETQIEDTLFKNYPAPLHNDSLVKTFGAAVEKEILPCVIPDDSCKIPDLIIFTEKEMLPYNSHEEGKGKQAYSKRLYLKYFVKREDALTVVLKISYQLPIPFPPIPFWTPVPVPGPKVPMDEALPNSIALLTVEYYRAGAEANNWYEPRSQSLALPLNMPQDVMAARIEKFAQEALGVRVYDQQDDETFGGPDIAREEEELKKMPPPPMISIPGILCPDCKNDIQNTPIPAVAPPAGK